MVKPIPPFPVPVKLPSGLAKVRSYWQGLKRRKNSMPFWDDVNPSSLSELADHVMLVDVFQDPQRFSFNSVGERIRKRFGKDLVHSFADEIGIKDPFDFFTSQASTTVESGAPTYYRSSRVSSGYHRLLLPMWGNGRIEMLLGAIVG